MVLSPKEIIRINAKITTPKTDLLCLISSFIFCKNFNNLSIKKLLARGVILCILSNKKIPAREFASWRKNIYRFLDFTPI